MRSVDVSPLGFKINGEDIDSTEEFNLLGLMMTSNISWDAHIKYIIRKANSRMWTIIRMRNSGVSVQILFEMFQLRVRSLLEYMCPACSGALSKQHILSIERVQKRYIKYIVGNSIFRQSSYLEICQKFEMDTLEQRRNELCLTFVKR